MLNIKKYGNWSKDTVVDLSDFQILKFTGMSLLMLNQAEVTLIYKNTKSLKIYGDQGKVFEEAITRIGAKKNLVKREKMLLDFEEAWNKANILGYSKYKEISGNTNPFSSLDPFKDLISKDRDKRLKGGLLSFLGETYYNSYITPSQLIQNKLAEKNMDVKDLAEAVKKSGDEQKQSATYTHISGERAVSRDVALKYSKILDCDPVDLMFAKRSTVVWGKVNTRKHVETYKNHLPGEIYSYVADNNNLETVTVPRDLYRKNIKAIKVDARGTMFDQHVAFYYFSNSKDENCLNKLCVVGTVVKPHMIDPDYEETNYYFGIYANDEGTSNLINADPFAKEKNRYILKDFDPIFVAPVAAIINPQSVLDETSKQDNIPDEVYKEELLKRQELAKANEIISKQDATKKIIDQTQAQTQKLMKEIDVLHQKILQQERIDIIRTAEEAVHGQSYYGKIRRVK